MFTFQTMSPIRLNACGNSSFPSKENVDRAHPTQGVQTQSRVTNSNCRRGVPRVPLSPPRAPQAGMFKVEFCQLIHLVTQLVVPKIESVSSVAPSSKVTRVGQFMRCSSPTFTSSKVEQDP